MPDIQPMKSSPVPKVSLRRRLTDHLMTVLAVLCVMIVLAPLIAIFGDVVYRGASSLNWAFFTQTPKPVGETGGGMANAIVGSLLILGIASIIGVPFGVGAGIYLAEFGRNRLGGVIRFTADVLNGVPSIVMGIVAFAIVVLYQKHFSALAGGVADAETVGAGGATAAAAFGGAPGGGVADVEAGGGGRDTMSDVAGVGADPGGVPGCAIALGGCVGDPGGAESLACVADGALFITPCGPAARASRVSSRKQRQVPPGPALGSSFSPERKNSPSCGTVNPSLLN